MLHGWCHVKCCRFGASSVYTIQPCTRLQCHFIQSHIGKVYVCLAITCHLHFWQNDRDFYVLLRWNGYQNKSEHRKLTPGVEKSPTAPARTQTRDLLITSLTLKLLSYPLSPLTQFSLYQKVPVTMYMSRC